MKKYITVAALLAAGTAFANAANPVEHKVTLGDATTTTISSGSASLWVDGVHKDGINFDYGWMMDFQISNVSIDSPQGIFYANGTDGLELSIAKKDESFFLGVKDSGDSGYVNASFALELALEEDVVYRMAYDKGYTESGDSTLDGVVYLINTESGAYASGTWANERKGYANIGTWAATFISDGNVDITVKKAYDMNGITGAEFKAQAVPEPSAFGLLAGVGALALVASRRRRK